MLNHGDQNSFLSCIFSKLFFQSYVERTDRAGFRLFVFRQCVPNDLFQNCLLIKWLGSFWFILLYCVLNIANFCKFLGTYWYSLNLCPNCTRITYSNNQDFTTNSRLSVKLFEFVIIISNFI